MRLPVGNFRVLIPGVLLLVALLICGGIVYDLHNPKAPQASARPELPVVGTYDNLVKLLEKSQGQNGLYGLRSTMNKEVMEDSAAPQSVGATPAPSTDYSGTNVQVQGVDEADLVKTDGTYIYQVNRERVCIIKAQPVDGMDLAATIRFDDAGFRPVDLYLDADNLIVIGTSDREVPNYNDNDNVLRKQIYPPILSFQSTRAIIYNINDKSRVTKVRELEMEGSYLSSRKIGSSFYLLTNKYLDYYYIQQKKDITPRWRDSIQGEEFVAEKLENIRYFPDCVSPNYLMAAALDLEKPTQTVHINTYLGSGEQVYASRQNLYVAVQRHDYVVRPLPEVGIAERGRLAESNTTIYKFELLPGQIQYYGMGQVPGRILNQFSMDENNGYFRIATTSGDMWRDDQYTSVNNVYVLNQDLQICGRLENIAPGEKIYSTRFIGDRAYMVTFKQIDPFFVLDLKDPLNPTILGKLKIPGYSDYLHPYDENHIIGFGKDTVETKGWNGQSQAFYQGMKIAIFDVTDVNNPIEMSKASIGDRGTDSELLRNHKALLFSAEKNLLAFPVTVMETTSTSNNKNLMPAYGDFSFQGLYVYGIDLVSGLQYRGRISHLTDQDYLKAGNAWYNSDKNIDRGLYIGTTLYTLSPSLIKAHDLSDLTDIKTLTLPQ